MPQQIGDQIDDLSFLRSDATAVRLSELAPGAVLLVFLRHLG